PCRPSLPSAGRPWACPFGLTLRGLWNRGFAKKSGTRGVRRTPRRDEAAPADPRPPRPGGTLSLVAGRTPSVSLARSLERAHGPFGRVGGPRGIAASGR